MFTVLIDPGRVIERKRLADAVSALAQFSLATVDDETVTVHRMLQKVVRDDARARSDQDPIARALAALDHAFPTDPADAAQWSQSEQLLSHVIALADAAAHVADVAEQLVALLNRACLYLSWAGGGARALALAQRTVYRRRAQPRP